MAAFLNCDSLLRKENDSPINYNTKMKCFLCEEDYPVYKLKMIARENEYVCKQCVKVSRSSGSRFDVTVRDMLRHVVAPIKLTGEQLPIKLRQSDGSQAEPSLAAPKTRTSNRTAPVASAQQFRATRKRNRKCRRRVNNNVTSTFQLCRIAASEPSSHATTTVATAESGMVTGPESITVSGGGGALIENDKAVIYSVQTLPKPPTTAIVVADAGSSTPGSGANVIVDMNDALKSICETLGLFKVDTADLRGNKSEMEIGSVERSISVNLAPEQTLRASKTAVLSRCGANEDDDTGEEGAAKLFEPDDDTNVDDQMANYFKLDDGAELCSIDHFLNTDEVRQHFLNDVSKNDQDLMASSFSPADHHHQRRTAKQKK